jgi:hypothetical protein
MGGMLNRSCINASVEAWCSLYWRALNLRSGQEGLCEVSTLLIAIPLIFRRSVVNQYPFKVNHGTM